ncbi:MAG: ceramidase domain-containing protein [Paracoccaceae bacterium]|nr:ceramidase domain-containing protein [Paracoccaceae bacterium]MDG1737852.1 ceramidase domain-containing protein [Paracoccaceae bacterium]MDG2257571.1 ceramidase domain-containing protein [Paracoccaceae bacterium]
MDWTAQIDGYCERVDFTFWAEPVNALTNFAFLIAAFVMWYRTKGQGMPVATGLVGIMAVIGLGSFLFHTFATQWASALDVLPILVFILVYIWG